MKISKENKELRKYKDPFDYLLSLKETGRAAIHDDLENMNKSATKLITSMNVQTEANIANTIRNLIDSKVIVPKDMKIDDGDLPTARNFYEWVTEDRFGTIGDERPFLEQLIWGLVTFNDVCYNNKCTDLEWLLHSHKVDDTYSKLERKVSLLQNGVCPNCGRGRSKMIKRGKMPFYNELAINAGQRCVIGTTAVFTSEGMEHMDEIYPDAPLGFSDFQRDVYNGVEMETTSHFFVASPEPIIRVQTAMGFRVSGTHDHPIFVNDAFTKLRDVQVGDALTVQYGQRIFGKDVNTQAEHIGDMFYNTYVPRTMRTLDEESTTLFLQGLFRQGPERIFVAKPALQDISFMLLNAGYPHSITGVSITLSDEQLQNLRAGKHSSGAMEDTIALISDGGVETTYDFTLPVTHQFITGAILSHNSGKSHTVGTYMFPYLIHRLLKLQKPAQFYGLSRTTMLQGTFAALTYTQAKDTLWTPFFGALTETRWYKEYHSMLRHYEGVYGETLFKLTDTFVDYRIRGLQCVVGSTVVETERGPIKIRDVVLGDRVKGLDGYNRVSGWHHNGANHVYKMRTVHGFEIVCTDNHPFLGFDGDKHPQWTELKTLKAGDFIAVAPKEFGRVKALYEEIESIEYVGREEVYDITVDVEDHAFVAAGFIQHNCFPMGPDKRVMRGRTRFGFCYAADTLVSTSAGLVKISDETIVGKNAIRGSHPCAITKWQRSHMADNVVKLMLKNGMELKVTADHKVLSLGEDLRTKKVLAGRMHGRFIGVTLGGEFPEKLPLKFPQDDHVTVTDQYVMRMCELGTFRKTDLTESDLPVFAGINAILAKLVGYGYAEKGKKVGRNGTCQYTMLKSVDECLTLTRGAGSQTRKKYEFLAPTKMTPKLAWLLAAMVADGSYNTDHEFTWVSGNADKAEKFCEYLHACFGVRLEPNLIERYDDTDKTIWRVNMGTRHVKNAFRYLGLSPATARFKEIPWSILQAPRDCAIAYVNAGFVTDGGLYSNRLAYSSRSKKMMLQYQMLLARCGYAGYVRRILTGSEFPEYRLRLYGDSTARFLQHDYDGSIKREWQQDYRKTFEGFKHVEEFEIPYTDGKKFVRGIGGRKTQKGFDPNIIWVEVIGIKKQKKQWVYDITVDSKDHMFTANGAIASNSIDEIAYFDAEKDSGKVKINAYEVYDALANSLATVRTAADALIERGYDDVLPAYAMNVSSPTAKNDMIHVLLDRAKNSTAMYGIHRATWEVNPNFKRNSTFIIEAYRKDPESAEKNFGANPPLIANPFISNHEFIANCEDTTRKNAVKIKPVYRTSKRLGQSYIYGKVEKVKKSGKASLMAIDAGVTDNSFSLVGGTTDGFNLSIDLVCEIIPLPGYRLNHSLIYSDVILPLMQARNCKVLLADRWNSIKLLDDAAADMGDPEEDIPTFIAKQYSLKYVDMVGVRTRMEQGQVSIPKSEIKVKTLVDAVDSDYREFYQDKPIAHLFKQMFTIKDQLKGVGKGDGYTDDNWRAMALCLWGLQVEDYALLLSDDNFDGAMARPTALAASKLAMGAGAVVGNASGGQTMINGAPIALFAAGRR